MQRNRYKHSNNKPIAITILAIAILLSACLLGFFGLLGKTISDFLTGIFGLAIYSYSLTIILMCITVLIGYSLNTSIKKILKYLTLFAFILFSLHIVTAKSILLDNNTFVSYLLGCYNGDTAGGLLAGVFLYFPCKFLSYQFALVLTISASVLFSLLAIFPQITFKKLPRKNKSKNVKQNNKKPSFTNFSELSSDKGRKKVGDNLFVDAPNFSNFKEKNENKNLKCDLLYPNMPLDEEKSEFIINNQLNNFSQNNNDKMKRKEAYDKLFNFQSSYNSTSYNGYDDDLNKKSNDSSSVTAFPNFIKDENKVDNINSLLHFDKDYKLYTNNYRSDLINNSSKDINSLDDLNNKNIESNNILPDRKEESTNYTNKFNVWFKPEKDIKIENKNLGGIDLFDDDKRGNSSRLIKKKDEINIYTNDKIVEEQKTAELYVDSHNKIINNNIKSFKEIESDIKINEVSRLGKDKLSKTLPGQLTINNDISKPIKRRPYIAPPVDLLTTYPSVTASEEEDFKIKSDLLEQTLANFHINATVCGMTKGPSFTRYELQMPVGVSVKSVQKYADDIAMNLEATKVRIEAPIPGKNLVGVELPNKYRSIVGLKSVISSGEFFNMKSPLAFCLGKDISNESQLCDLTKMPHLLIAGSTGSGKSVCINTLIISLLYKASPDDLKLILIDPKRVELNIYNGLPHLLLKEVITERAKAINAFNWVVKEMENRYKVLDNARVKNIKEYNEKVIETGEGKKLPYIVLIVDELADLMTSGSKREVEEKIMRIAQLSRAAGIHLVLATQRPSVDIITGVIKTNLPSRIAFTVTNFQDSKTILDQGGAEKLLGEGDMLFNPVSFHEPKRLQGAYLSNKEVDAVVSFIKENNDSYYDDNIEKEINFEPEEIDTSISENEVTDEDQMLSEVLNYFIEQNQASTSMIQRRYRVGYARASRMIDQMEQRGFISGLDGSKPRIVLISREQFLEIYGDLT